MMTDLYYGGRWEDSQGVLGLKVWMMEAGGDVTVCELSEDVLSTVSVIGYSYLPTAF